MTKIQYTSRLTDPIAAASGDNTLLTVDEGQRWVITKIKAVNNGTTKVTIKVGLNSSADSALLIPDSKIPSKGMLNLPSDDILEDGENLIANCSATGLTLTVYGTKQYPRHA